MTLSNMRLRQIEDAVLADFLAVAVLHDRFETGALDAGRASGPAAGGPVVQAVLHRAGVVDGTGAYSPEFRALLSMRGAALRARIRFARDAARDILDHGSDLLGRPERFMAVSRVFSFFDYAAGFRDGPVARAATQDWCTYVAALSDIEGPPLVELIARMLAPNAPEDIFEVGGNVGAFAAHVVAALHPARYRILDIPQVCAIGKDHAARIGLPVEFLAGDMHRTDWQAVAADGRPDCILFKSVLHDWPTDRADSVLSHALGMMSTDGRLLIAERAAFAAANLGRAAFSDAANAVFAPFYRAPDVYRELIARLRPGARIRIETLDLDMRWFVLVADLA